MVPNAVCPRIALGRAYVSWGWSARGTAFSDKVAKEGWGLLAQRLNKADAILKDAENILRSNEKGIRSETRLGTG